MKKTRISNNDQGQEDRISSLPDVLLISILSLTDTKLAVQSSILSKRWVNLWTMIHILNFDSSLHNIGFDTFIDKVFTYGNVSVKIDSVNIKVADHNTIARVFHYAMSHSVTKLSIDTCQNLCRYYPITCDNSSNTLMSLTLKGMLNFGRFPKFDNLVSLRLERVKIIESELFSCFPNLEELVLVDFKLPGDLYGLEVISFRLLRLTISSCYCNFSGHQKLMLLTPKLVFLNLQGLIPVNLEAYEAPLLETIRIDHCYPVATMHRRGASRKIMQ
ncbi:F-box domain, cyclin-like protein [Artemisia annua]|uniref:F-box domain, cyclin-like protein n=1 Tax=Artemisia annua TaxID=35608 RepID=A0A2U1N2K3_ARTAN|nr:F-box domain, cyclin-like protein [Artemisia annua]